jgi:hypothetical protein
MAVIKLSISSDDDVKNGIGVQEHYTSEAKLFQPNIYENDEALEVGHLNIIQYTNKHDIVSHRQNLVIPES